MRVEFERKAPLILGEKTCNVYRMRELTRTQGISVKHFVSSLGFAGALVSPSPTAK